MTELRIFSYLPNPRIWKATIAARLCGVEIELRGSAPRELQDWLWDFDARPLSEYTRCRRRARVRMTARSPRGSITSKTSLAGGTGNR